ncbi:hypothetical protein [Pseudomonas sp.]|uniref:hypothetical protein n=1 Tax=Pseudomonas sp. TaxID=306 RepID=UPI003FD7F784
MKLKQLPVYHEKIAKLKQRSHDKVMAELFHSDPSYAAELLNEVRRDGDSAELAIVL